MRGRGKTSAITALAVVVLAALTGAVAAPVAAAKGPTCAKSAHPGGDWPSYGQNLANTRAQDKEKTIDASNVASLTPAWTFTPTDEGGTGSLQTTPVIAQGCVYITTGSGYIYALNADSGELVWKGDYAETVSGVCCGETLFAPTVEDGVLYAYVSRNSETAGRGKGPYAIALDADTGKLIWKSKSVADEPGAYTNASVVLYKGLLFFGISNAEMGDTNAGGFAILEAKTGKVIHRTHTVPFSHRKKGFGGGSIWTTAAVDEATGYAFAGTGQPTAPHREHERINAILKMDLNRNHKTFGQIVDAYKGTPDSRLHGQQTCQGLGENPGPAAIVGCAYTDVDFAASPTILEDSRGQKLVVEFQKSGIIHSVFAETMERSWDALLSPIGAPAGNYTSTATDGKSVFAMGTYPGQLFSLEGDYGGYEWVSPVITTIGGNPVSYANGVVYHADGKGFFDAYDSETGVPLVHKPMSSDIGAPCSNLGGGVAIARNTVYAVCGESVGASSGEETVSGWVIAYRL